MSRTKFGSIFMAVLLAVLLFPRVTFAAQSWSEVVGDIENYLDQAVNAYAKGDAQGAKQLVSDAYFGPFEKEGMERVVRSSISSRRAFEHENKFTQIKRLITSGADTQEVKKAVEELKEMLRQDAARLDGSSAGPFTVFLSSFSIIVREGFEAILIIGAIIAYLIKTGHKDRVPVIYQSALWAIVASALTALALKFVFKLSGAGQEVLEGATMLIAVAVLFSVSFWIISKAEAEKWRSYIEGKVQSSLSTGNSLALWSAVFLAVYREGAETVLFYQALLAGQGANGAVPIGLGFVLGAVALAVIFVIVRYGSIRVPLKPFFLFTGSLLYYLAFVFAGQGMQELQEGGVLSATHVSGVPVIDFLGIYPTWETLSLQILLILAAVGGLLYQKFFARETKKAVG